MFIIFEKVTSVFILILMGYAARKLGVLKPESKDSLVSLMINVIGPCMLITSLLGKEIDKDTLPSTIEVLALGALGYVLAVLIGYLYYGKINKTIPEDDIGVYIALLGSGNIGFMAFPLSLAIFGTEVFYYVVIYNILNTLYCFTFALMIFHIGENRRGDKNHRSAFRSLLNISTVSTFIGLFLLCTGIHIPNLLYEPMSYAADANIPIAMIIVGITLADSDLKNAVKNINLFMLSFGRLILMPVIMFVLVNWLPISENVKISLIYASAFPAASLIVPLSSMEKKNTVLAAEGVANTILISVITLPIISVLLIRIYGIA